LLKDRNGLIHLDVPVQGRIDDPKFRVGPIIWQVIVNIMIKAATSPFALLGAAFGGGDELSFVEFAPAEAVLAESEAKKLDTLAKALYERPAVNLEIRGSVDPAKDRLPMARVKMEHQLRSMWVKEQTDAGKPAVAQDSVQLEPDERNRLLRKLHRQLVGPYVPTPIPTNDATGAVSNSIAGRLAAMPKRTGTERGASQLIAPQKPAGSTGTPVTSTPAPTSAASPFAGRPLESLSRTELELLDMEDQLINKLEVTPDDLRDLMQARAKMVKDYLLKTGKVADERLFIIAPKTIDASFKGEDRANLSLN
jgi:hypothetical protein